MVGSQWPVQGNVGPQMFLKFARIINYHHEMIFSLFSATCSVNQSKYNTFLRQNKYKKGKGLTPLKTVPRNAGGWRINYKGVR